MERVDCGLENLFVRYLVFYYTCTTNATIRDRNALFSSKRLNTRESPRLRIRVDRWICTAKGINYRIVLEGSD